MESINVQINFLLININFFFLFLISIIFSIHTGFINQLFKQTFTNDLHVRLGDTNIKKIVSTLKELINLLSKREK